MPSKELLISLAFIALVAVFFFVVQPLFKPIPFQATTQQQTIQTPSQTPPQDFLTYLLYLFNSLGLFNLILIFLLLLFLIKLAFNSRGIVQIVSITLIGALLFMLFIAPFFLIINSFPALIRLGLFGILVLWAVLAIIPPYPTEELVIAVPLMLFGIPFGVAELIALTIAIFILVFASFQIPYIWQLIFADLSKINIYVLIVTAILLVFLVVFAKKTLQKPIYTPSATNI